VTSDHSWGEAEPAALLERLAELDAPPSAEIAELVWQRAAGQRLAAPAMFLDLATALLRVVEPGCDPGAEAPSFPAAPAVSPEAGTARVRAIAWCCYAEAANAGGHIARAIRAYDRATAHATIAGCVDLTGRILVGRVHVLSLAGRADEAEVLFQQAARLLEDGGDTILLAKLFTNRGNAFYQQDRYAPAFDAYAHAARLLGEAAPDDPTRGVVLLNQAIAAVKLERVGDARRLYADAEAVGETLGLTRLTAFALYNRALLEQGTGDYRRALTLLERAGDTFDNLGTSDMVAAVTLARAEIHLELGMPGVAVSLAEAAARVFASEGMELDAELARTAAARSHAQLGDHDRAHALLREILGAFETRGNRPRQALTHLYVAEAALECNRAEEALAAVERALAGFTELGMRRWMAHCRVLGAHALLVLGAPGAAESMLRPLQHRSQTLPLTERQALWAVAGRTALASGRRALARRRLERAARLLEAARRLIPGTEYRARAFAAQVRVYHDLVALELERPRLPALLGYTERARGRGFRDLIARPTGTGAVVDDERRLRLGTLTRRLEAAELDDEAGQGSVDVEALRRQVIDLERELVTAWRRSGEREDRAPEESLDVDLDRILAALHPEEALITYFVTGERIVAAVLGAGRRGLVVLPSTSTEVRKRLEQVRFQLDSALMMTRRAGANLAFLRRSADAALTDLYGALLAPVEDLLPPRGRLTVVPHAFLHGVPFEALHDGTGYIDTRWVVARSPLVDQVGRRASVPQATRPVLVAGTVRTGPAAVRDELRAVAACYAPGECEIVEDPTTAGLLERLTAARLVHVVSHGAHRTDNPLLSRLTTDDGAVFLADVLGRRLDAELVVLSACGTGQVFSGEGEDLHGLALAFLAAGARRLVASLWRIDDPATVALMAAFHRRIAAGGTDVATALAAAARDVRGRWDHPFFWGGFCLYGG
jgi:CHAT domain-containing protein